MNNKPANSAKKLLKDCGSSLDATSFLNGLILAGIIERIEYPSTTGSGEIKHYLKIKDEALEYGINASSGFHEFKTEPRFYLEKFYELIVIACKSLLEEAIKISSKSDSTTA